MKVEQSVRLKFKELVEKYKVLSVELEGVLSESCKKNGWFFDGRVKSEESYALKLSTGRFPDSEIDDFYACTIIVPNLRYVEGATKLIQACFEVDEIKPGKEVKSWPTDFSFNSIRMTCRRKGGVKSHLLDSCIFEVQIKTLLEHACSEATHDFSYKGVVISWGRERLAAQIKAVLDNVDLSILEMEKLSSSSFLDKKNTKYELQKEIADFIHEEWGDKGPEDLKRLSEVFVGILDICRLSVDDLKNALMDENNQGRGKNITNLSIYSILLQSLINHHGGKIIDYLKQKKQPRRPQVFLPPEIELPEGIELGVLNNIVVPLHKI